MREIRIAPGNWLREKSKEDSAVRKILHSPSEFASGMELLLLVLCCFPTTTVFSEVLALR